jgi:oligopeptide/dipeptide ABC transporter ATP-binding protein
MSTATAEPLLCAHKLTKTFGGRRHMGGRHPDVHAVRDVSFEVTARQALGIVGESGSGKTTVARMLVGAEAPTAGELVLGSDRLDISDRRSRHKQVARQIQMVFQDPYTSLDPRQSIAAALDEVQRVHFARSRETRQERTRMLGEAVGLGEREMRALPRALSGGERQRAAIARALAAEPAVLVLDEALSALDVSIQAQILNLLADLRSQFALTYILISHDMAVIRQLCDEAVVMYRGEVMEQGPVDAIMNTPAHPYTARLLDSIPKPGMPLPQRAAALSVAEGGCVFQDRCAYARERCATPPPPVAVTPGHVARCWFVGEAASPNCAGAREPER